MGTPSALKLTLMTPSPVRPNVLRMRPYSPGRPIDEVERERGLTNVIKLASNENPLGGSPLAKRAMSEALEKIHLYPDAAVFGLTTALSGHLGISKDQIFVGNGSDELLTLIGLAFLSGPEDEIIVGNPSFVRYDSMAELAPCGCVQVPLTADLRLDIPAMIAAITPRTKLILLANPNNPTGTRVTRTEVDALLAALPSGVTVVLDEAYFEFACDDPEFPSSTDYVRQGQPVIGLRTFSKTYGLAGIRVGYGFASPEIAEAIQRVRAPFNVNSLAQIGAIAALSDSEFIAQTVTHNQTERARLMNVACELGLTPIPSAANFVLIDLGCPANPWVEKLLDRGVIVRSGVGLGLPNCMRVSVGTTAEMDRFFAALTEIVNGDTPTA